MQVLAAFFHGKGAPINRLAIDPAFDRIPDDFIEAWATAIWSVDLCHTVVSRAHPLDAMLKPLDTLRGLVRKWTGLTEAEFSGELYKSNVARLESRFGQRLRGQAE